ncbi:RND transporter [Colwellia sp. 75C3]|uniref:efflux RND transporter periplasmic adaptor subunit n=1 Tax=Colwellia sp. 75C3 TaxID=888425 RepID=UPI000C31BB4C|nr:efflux RND transporter periplasmic adaptor subunit [Colwellia sp. 75C3]PKG81589.1 RND transporter [Colwellia sp. 75C3]
MNSPFLAQNIKHGILISTLIFILPFSLTSNATSQVDKHSDSRVAVKENSSIATNKAIEHGDETEHKDEHTNDHGEEHGDEHSEEGHIAISAEMIKTVDITSLTATSGEIKQRLTLYGTSTTEPSAVSQVRARFPGIITLLSANVGDKVEKGQLIAEIESNNSLMRYSIHSAISGVITQRNANPGELANEQVLLTIEDHQKLWLELQVFATQQSKIAIGQSVRISMENQVTDSVISQILPSRNDSPFSIARVALDNSQSKWSIGSLLVGSVVINKLAVPLIIDNSAIQVMEGKQVIFVKNEQGFEVRVISLGLSDGQFSQVLSGLKKNEIYAVKNSYLLKAELEKSSAEHHH